MMFMRPQTQHIFWLLAALVPMALVAQWQVNTQVNRGGGGGPAAGAVRYSNTLGYGNTINNQSAGAMLPSQMRYATWKSGATRSEIVMNARAVGPLSPSGSVAYVPQTTNVYAPRAPTAGNYADTRVNNQLAPPVSNLPPIGQAPTAANIATYATPIAPPAQPVTGSVRYSVPTSPSTEVTPFNTLTTSSNSSLPIGQTMGSVKYAP